VLPEFFAVIPAAGRGLRMALSTPKQYLQIGGACVLEHSLAGFLAHPRLKHLVLALSADDPYWATLPCASNPRIATVTGGGERADSVLAALRQLAAMGAQADDWVLVHDAARPNLAPADLDRLLGTLADDDIGGLLAVPARDTLKRAGADGRVDGTLCREQLWHALTPQMFRFAPLYQALAGALAAGVAITDEASALEWAGFRPKLVEGRWDNLKITRPQDLELLQGRL